MSLVRFHSVRLVVASLLFVAVGCQSVYTLRFHVDKGDYNTPSIPVDVVVIDAESGKQLKTTLDNEDGLKGWIGRSNKELNEQRAQLQKRKQMKSLGLTPPRGDGNQAPQVVKLTPRGLKEDVIILVIANLKKADRHGARVTSHKTTSCGGVHEFAISPTEVTYKIGGSD